MSTIIMIKSNSRVSWTFIRGFLVLILSYLSTVDAMGQANTYDRALGILGMELEAMDRDSAIRYWTSEFSNTDTQENPLYKGYVAITLSKAYNTPRECDDMLKWNKIAEGIFKQTGDRRGLAEVKYQEAYYAFCNMDYEVAMAHTLDGLAVMEDLSDNDGIALGYFRLAQLYHFTYNMSLSAKYGDIAADLFEVLGDYAQASESLSWSGNAYRVRGDLDKAYASFSRGAYFAELTEISTLKVASLKNLCLYHLFKDEYSKSEEYGLRANTLIRDTSSRLKMIIDNTLGQLYLETGQYEKSVRYTKDALRWVYDNKDLFFLSELPAYLGEAYAGLGMHDSAYKYTRINLIYTDSLFEHDTNQNQQELEKKYETEKKELLINKQKTERYYGLGLIGILMALGFALWNRYQAKMKLNIVLREKNEEKDFLMKEIHHRVKNNLQILSSLLSLQSDSEDDSMVLDALQESRNRVDSMGLIHQKLYTRDKLTAINIGDYMTDLCNQLEDTYYDEARLITIEPEVQIGFVDVETAIPLGLIINELITNSVKYAFDTMDEGTIKVRLWEEGGVLKLKVSDNGNSKSQKAFDKQSTNFGSRLIEILCKKLKGRITVDRTNGYETAVDFERYKLS